MQQCSSWQSKRRRKEMKRINSESLALIKLNIEKLKELFPNVVT